MRAFDGSAGWGWVTRLLHWTMAALILFQLGFGLYMVQAVPDLLRRFSLTQTHKSWGFVVFALAVLRVLWRLANRRRPALPPAMPRWQVRAAEASHRLLYLLMFVMPVSGWIMASASPTQDLLQMQNMVFGAFALPDPFVPGVGRVEDLARAVHVGAAILLAGLLAVHAGAALKHQLVDRDGLLAAMLLGSTRAAPPGPGGAA
jgi:cytochrome b561